MSYPILKTSVARSIGEQINFALESNPRSSEPLNAGYMNFEKEIEHRHGGDWNEAQFRSNINLFERNQREDRLNGDLTRVRLEQDFAQHFVAQMELVDDAALQDPDFWRFLALFPYRRYVHALRGHFKSSAYGGDGNRSLIRWALIEGAVWGMRTFDPEKAGDEQFWATRAYSVAKADAGITTGSDADFYISQIVRRDWSYNKNSYLAYLEAVTEAPALFDESNEKRRAQDLGALVGRVASNLYFPALSRGEIKAIVLEEKAKVPVASRALDATSEI